MATTLPDGPHCAPRSWAAGRKDFDGWLSSSTTVERPSRRACPSSPWRPGLLRAPGAAFDKQGPDNDSLVARQVDAIIGEMHADGTLSTMAETWFGLDLTTSAAE